MELPLQWSCVYNDSQEHPLNTIDDTTGMDPTVKAKLQEACNRVASGEKISKEERKAAAARIDNIREENAKILGIQEVAVDLVRQARNSR